LPVSCSARWAESGTARSTHRDARAAVMSEGKRVLIWEPPVATLGEHVNVHS
jgi:hypothetical protein